MIFVITPILLLTFISIVIVVIHYWQPRFVYHWLIAAVSSLLMWPIILLALLEIPLLFSPFTWFPQTIYPVSLSLLLDHVSWSFALALLTLLLGVILTDIVRISGDSASMTERPITDWTTWSISLFMTASGLLAVFAGNLLTTLVAWAAIDLLELIVRIRFAQNRQENTRIVLAFTARVASIFILLWAGAIAISARESISLNGISTRTSLYLLLAAGLRLGVLPVNLPLIRSGTLRRSLSLILRLVPVAASLVMLTRSATAGLPQAALPYLYILASMAALFSSISWIAAKNELDGMPYWILTISAFTIFSALSMQPASSLSWGIALLLSGGILLLYSAREKKLLFIPIIGLIFISNLPFTPTWEGVFAYQIPLQPWLSIVFSSMFLVSHALILLGYLRHGLRQEIGLSKLERYVWVIYPWGLILLPFSQILISWLNRNNNDNSWLSSPTIADTWPAFLATAIALLGALYIRRDRPTVTKLLKRISGYSSFGWFYRIIWGLFNRLSRVINLIDRVFEGRAALLWVLLLLTMLLTLLVQNISGG